MKLLEAREATVMRGGRTILDRASMRLLPGEVVGIVGPNGSGKSTLLRTLAGLWKPDEGSILLDGKTLSAYSRRELAQCIAFLPQETRIDFAFTVEELVSMGRYPHRGRFSWESRADRVAIEKAMEDCDIVHLRSRAANTLSGGERQRVLIARSLAVQPHFVLLDEPTASLDVQHALEILELCRTLAAAGKAIAISTHDLNAVSRYAAAVVLTHAGRLTGSGPVHEVLTARALADVFHVHAEVLRDKDGNSLYQFHRK